MDWHAGARYAGTGRLLKRPPNFMRMDAGIELFVCVLVMWFSPKIASAIDILLRPELQRASSVVAGRFVANCIIEASVLDPAVSDSVVRPHNFPVRLAVRVAKSAGSARHVTITRYP